MKFSFLLAPPIPEGRAAESHTPSFHLSGTLWSWRLRTDRIEQCSLVLFPVPLMVSAFPRDLTDARCGKKASCYCPVPSWGRLGTEPQAPIGLADTALLGTPELCFFPEFSSSQLSPTDSPLGVHPL